MLFVLKFIVLTLISSCMAEFYFSKNPSPKLNPSYLFKHFTNVTEDKFPSKLEISCVFSSFDGMLLTSLDQYTNFLIAEIFNNSLFIHYNNESNEIYLPLLCNCKRKCLNEKLDITVLNEMNRMKFKCNDGGYYSLIKYSERPIKPNIAFEKIISVSNQAYVWIINYKYYPFYRPYPNQMIGCIFEIKYKDKIINMDPYGNHIIFSCVKQISNKDVHNLCNGGKFVEMHSKYNFTCDCTTTLFNGPRCNEGVTGYKPVNIKMKLNYSMFKVSWWTNNDVIMNVTTHLNDQIYGYLIIRKVSLKLVGEVYISSRKKQSKEILANYDPNIIYSVILNFMENKLVIQIPKVNSNKYLFNFLSIKTKKSNNKMFVYGAISLGYKINSGTWKNIVDLEIEKQSTNNCFLLTQPNTIDKCGSYTVSYVTNFAVIGILLFIFIYIIISIYVFKIKSKKNQRKSFKRKKFIDTSYEFLGTIVSLVKMKTTVDVRNILDLPSCPPFNLNYNYGQVTVYKLKKDIAKHIKGNKQDILLWINKQILTENNLFSFNIESLEVDFLEVKEFEGFKDNLEIRNIRRLGIVYKIILSNYIEVAAKYLKDVIKDNREDDIRQIFTEVKILQMINDHKNIVHFHSFTRIRYDSFLLSNVSVGWKLNTYVMQKKKLDDFEIKQFLQQILSGLSYIHQKRIIHLDINCDNMLMTEIDKVIKLTEFSASVILDKGCDYSTEKVNSTAKFMAPELLDEDRKYTTKADIWSLGCSIIQMATGQPPFNNLSENAAIFRIYQTKLVEYDNKPVSEYLKGLISKCTKSVETERPDSGNLLNIINEE